MSRNNVNLNEQIDLSRALAPEEIEPGSYVSILKVVIEHLPCCENLDWRELELKRLAWLPWGNWEPMYVVEVCLPYVLVKCSDGTHTTIDTRRFRLARVTRRFGREVFRRARRDAKAARRKSDGGAEV